MSELTREAVLAWRRELEQKQKAAKGGVRAVRERVPDLLRLMDKLEAAEAERDAARQRAELAERERDGARQAMVTMEAAWDEEIKRVDAAEAHAGVLRAALEETITVLAALIRMAEVLERVDQLGGGGLLTLKAARVLQGKVDAALAQTPAALGERWRKLERLAALARTYAEVERTGTNEERANAYEALIGEAMWLDAPPSGVPERAGQEGVGGEQ